VEPLEPWLQGVPESAIERVQLQHIYSVNLVTMIR